MRITKTNCATHGQGIESLCISVVALAMQDYMDALKDIRAYGGKTDACKKRRQEIEKTIWTRVRIRESYKEVEASEEDQKRHFRRLRDYRIQDDFATIKSVENFLKNGWYVNFVSITPEALIEICAKSVDDWENGYE